MKMQIVKIGFEADNEIRRNTHGDVGAVCRFLSQQLTAVLGYDAATARAIMKRQSRNTGKSLLVCPSLKKPTASR